MYCSRTEEVLNSLLLVEVAALECSLSISSWETHLHKHLNFSIIGGLESVILNPLLRGVLVQLSVGLEHVGNLRILWIIGLR